MPASSSSSWRPSSAGAGADGPILPKPAATTARKSQISWRKPGAWWNDCCSKAFPGNLRYSQQAGCISRTEGCILTSPPKYLILKNIFVISALLVCVCGVFCPSPAQAQIYSWKDANGIMVLSNVPGGGANATLHGLIARVSAPLLIARVSGPHLMSTGASFEPAI